MASLRLRTAGPPVAGAFAGLRAELELPVDYPAPAVAEADAAAGTDLEASGRIDRTAIELRTIDPEGSMDLDQAFALERIPGGIRLHYAIADLAAFVHPGGPLDLEVHLRGVTRYLPDGRVPLHPDVLGIGAASLLPGQVRPAVLWTIDVAEGTGLPMAAHVERATVRSVERLSYDGAQRVLDGPSTPPHLGLLREVGLWLERAERVRGGVHLAMPEQEVVAEADGSWGLRLRAPLPIEDWNAQLSLLTGRVAGQLQLDAGYGLLRTLPPASGPDVEAVRRSARALGFDWAVGEPWSAVAARLVPGRPVDAAILGLAVRLLRGAGHLAMVGSVPADAVTTHAGVGGVYSHVTAPLRRLGDRYATEAALAACEGRVPPGWVEDALPSLPEELAVADHRAKAVERAVVDLVEARLLINRVGEVFDGVAVEKRTVQILDPAVRAPSDGDLPVGEKVRVRLKTVDVDRRRVQFSLA